MITIDVSQLELRPRGSYSGVEFRRNDRDRQAARPVCRPNDGPGDWAERERLAAVRLEIASRKRCSCIGGIDVSRAERIQQESHALLLAASQISAPANIRTLSMMAMVPDDRASTLFFTLHNDGFVTKARAPNGKGGREIHITITEAGLSKLAEAGL